MYLTATLINLPLAGDTHFLVQMTTPGLTGKTVTISGVYRFFIRCREASAARSNHSDYRYDHLDPPAAVASMSG